MGGACVGCSLEQEVLAGSVLDVDVHGVHPRVAFQVRSSAPEVADVKVSARCRFIGHEGCRDGIAVVTKAAGDADLEVYDDWTGTVFDRITVKVRDAASLETVVMAASPRGGSPEAIAPTAGGVFELAVDSDVEIRATARTASGEALIATSGAIHGAYEDERVVGPRVRRAASSPAEYARANRPGTTSVTVLGGGAQSAVVFRVFDAR